MQNQIATGGLQRIRIVFFLNPAPRDGQIFRLKILALSPIKTELFGEIVYDLRPVEHVSGLGLIVFTSG